MLCYSWFSPRGSNTNRPALPFSLPPDLSVQLSLLIQDEHFTEHAGFIQLSTFEHASVGQVWWRGTRIPAWR